MLISLFSSKLVGKLFLSALAILLALFVSTAKVQAQDSTSIKLPVSFQEAYKAFTETREMLELLDELLTNFNDCLAEQGDFNTCAQLILVCELQPLAIEQLYPSFVSELQIFGAFQAYCDTGECFQCCKTPDGGCHTSFKGFPVINCNDNYGFGTFPAGMTLIVDPNVEPGQACLFTPQTCDHIPACRYVPGANLEDLENNPDPNDPLNLDHARQQRLRYFAEFLREQLQQFLNDFFTGEFDADQVQAAVASPFTHLDATTPPSLYELAHFLSGRGCQNWRTNMGDRYPFDWTDPLFAITDTNGLVLDAPSHWNGVQQLATLRVLASIPNVKTRLDYTDSRIWTQASKNAYLAQVGDPDQALLRYMSPFALAILKNIYSIQDYRLLAVPRPGEPELTNQFNGCTLGQPPSLALTATHSSADTIVLDITITNQETAPATNPGMMLIDWGDGTVTHLEYAATQSKVTATHTYAVGGKRLIMAMTDSGSGLRGIGALVVEATAGSASATPAVAKLILRNLTARLETLSGNEWNTFFDLRLTDAQSRTVGAGRTANQLVKFNADTPFGNIHVDNPGRYPFTKLVLEPNVSPGFTIGFNANYITLDGLTLAVYSSALDGYITRTIPITFSMVHAYPVSSTLPLPTSALTVTESGLVKIPLQRRIDFDIETIDRVEFLFDPTWLQDLVVPAATAYTVGEQRILQEVRPGHFMSEQTLTFPVLANRTFGDAPFAVAASASSELSVTLTSATTTVCTVTANKVTVVGAGLCTLVASQPGNDLYLAQSVTQTFTVNKANQAISFGPLSDQPIGASPVKVAATASSGLPVTVASTTSAICTVQPGDKPEEKLIILHREGLCSLVASQVGDGNYLAAAEVVQSFTISSTPTNSTLYLPTIRR